MLRTEWLELMVESAEGDRLDYQFRSVEEALEIILFLRDFFPGARFVMQPLLH